MPRPKKCRKVCQMPQIREFHPLGRACGDPAVIPNLSYEQFIQFHKDYYHPANSYIYLYGDMDMEEKLLWLDKEYLSAYDKNDYNLDSSIALQKPFSEPVEKETVYSVTANEGTEDNTYLSLNTVVGTDIDPVLYVAFQILDYTLISAPGAPLKQALIDAADTAVVEAKKGGLSDDAADQIRLKILGITT